VNATLLLTAGLWVAGLLGALYGLISVVGNNLYELQAIRRQRQAARRPHARYLRRRPLVTVVVVAHNQATAVVRTLESLAKNTYRNTEAVVVDLASQDMTRPAVADFIAAHPKLRLRLVAKRASPDPAISAYAAFKRHGKGALVLTLPAGYRLQPQTVQRAVMLCNANDKIGVVLPYHQVRSTYRVLGILQQYRELLGYREQKVRSVLGVGVAVGPVALYRREVYMASHKAPGGSRRNELVSTVVRYADDAGIESSPPSSFSLLVQSAYQQSALGFRGLSVGRWSSSFRHPAPALLWSGRWLWLIGGCVMALLLPVLIGYVIFLAVRLQAATYLVALSALLSLLLLFAVWDDKRFSARQKLGYSLGIPLTYSYFVLLSVVRAVAVTTMLLTAALRTI
jgi:glycosyl transferase family 2